MPSYKCVSILIVLFLHIYANEFQIPASDLIKIFNNFECIEASTILEKETITENYDLYVKSPLNISNLNKNTKSLLTTIHELADYNKITYNYVLVAEEGPSHSKVFRVVLNLGDEQYQGEGGSLKKAQKVAAQYAIDQTAYTLPPTKFGVDQQKQTPTVILNNIATKLGIKVTYQIDDKIAIDSNSRHLSDLKKINLSDIEDGDLLPSEDGQITGPFLIKALFDNREFLGYGRTIQAARHNAAIKALHFIKEEANYQNHICNIDESDENCRQKRDTLKSPISRLYELAQQQRFSLEFDLIEESGRDHRKKFVTQCRINDDLVTIGEGSSKKESKRIAAENMLEELSHFNFNNFNEKQIIDSFKSNKNQNKKKKKKSKKLIKNNENIIKSTIDSISSFFNSKENVENHKRKLTPKQKLLEIGNLFQFDIKFNNLGEAVTEDGSIKNAAINGLKFIKKTDLFDKLSNDNKLNSIEIDLMINDDNEFVDYIEES